MRIDNRLNHQLRPVKITPSVETDSCRKSKSAYADLAPVQTPNKFGGISRGAPGLVGVLRRLATSAWLVRRLGEQ